MELFSVLPCPACGYRHDVFFEEGGQVEIAVEDADGLEVVAGSCTVQGAVEEGWARAVVFYFAPPNNYINCANGFVPSP